MKTRIGAVPYVYPIPIVLVGTEVGGRPNFATIGDVGLVGINPPLVSISLNSGHHTTTGILEHQVFSINFPSTVLLAKTDYCGIVSGRDVDKASLFEIFHGELEHNPMIVECPVNIECTVVKEFSIKHRQVFIGEVVATHVTDELVEHAGDRKRVCDLPRPDPILYALDNRYYRVGEAIGTGYHEGRSVKAESLNSGPDLESRP